LEELVQRQITLWEDALGKSDERRREAELRHEERFTAGLQSAMDRTLEIHATRLAAGEEKGAKRSSGNFERVAKLGTDVQRTGQDQHASLAAVCEKLAQQVEASARLGEEGRELRLLQESLNQNLVSLAETGRFEEAMHSLTAAIHLLTVRAAPPSGGIRTTRPGNAA